VVPKLGKFSHCPPIIAFRKSECQYVHVRIAFRPGLKYNGANENDSHLRMVMLILMILISRAQWSPTYVGRAQMRMILIRIVVKLPGAGTKKAGHCGRPCCGFTDPPNLNGRSGSGDR
jgi:hypothetical protein